MPHLFRRLLLAALLLACATACAPPPTIATMVPDLGGMQGAPAPSYRTAITVSSVRIGSDSGTPWRSAVRTGEVQEALVRTLTSAGLLAQGSGGRFRLDVLLLTLDRPYAGFAMTVTAAIAYRLTDSASGAVVYDQTLTGVGTATLDDAVDNDSRLRIADQRAVRASFQQLVRDLSVLPPR